MILAQTDLCIEKERRDDKTVDCTGLNVIFKERLFRDKEFFPGKCFCCWVFCLLIDRH